MLKIEDINVTFHKQSLQEKRALRNLSLTLEKGDFVSVIGSNGAGKSTLLNAISGNCLIDHGKIELDGQQIQNLPAYKRAKVIGRLFQNPILGTAPHMTIEENLVFACKHQNPYSLMRGLKQSSVQQFKELVAILQLGLEHQMQTEVGLLSGGQRQALSLLMATISKPKLLLLDEHTAALDPITADQVMKLTNQIVNDNGITTIMITHNIKQALQYGNKMILMNQGTIVGLMSEEQKKKMTVTDVLALYTAQTNSEFKDSMLL